ncbi:nicotinate phosphoribosyltransferase [Pseudoflavitalea sp. X16]|uniref:nicotinate phosphoribosyltransferase n=1 Tax=Paraflavitalea devenefica TaxID=2716334 RepID=UPI00141EA9B2|nr:nicotinate phosphoribosyltransferase [Paraflavitalea devenefica]NII24475.1 nicotinate phosphoribosyltransferase [Paraflavitalea devenefica]
MKTQENILLLADAYKYSHHKLYYPGTTKIYSYLESRGGQFDETVFFGLQYFLKYYLEGEVITTEKIDAAAGFLEQVFGRQDVFDRSKFDYIVQKHGGRLPVRIKAVPEGTHVPVNNVLVTIENTDPECFWLTNFLETLLMQVWYPCTVATLSSAVRTIATEYFQETASESAMAAIDFVLNDFGFRGVSSVESAGLGGAAHLLNFNGSDNIMASVLAQRYYGANRVIGLSVPATEHSICTLLGEEGELEVFKHVLRTFPSGTVACVSDSFDIFRACSEYWGTELKELVLSRDGVLVIRPDSGDPVFTLLRVFDILMDKFGYTFNEKGYKVLPPQVRVLQGDGVTVDTIRHIYSALKINGISAENLVLGMGGALLQKVDRDTQQFAFKCSYAEVNGEATDVQKHPIEIDSHGRLVESFKRSKAGQLKLIQTEEGYRTIRKEQGPAFKDELVTVFENGALTYEVNFEGVRERACKEKKEVTVD